MNSGRKGEASMWLVQLMILMPLAAAGMGKGALASSSQMLGTRGGIGALSAFLPLGSRGPIPSYSVSSPTKDSSLTQIRWPMCFGKHSAMLGSFCVAQQDPDSTEAGKQGLMMEMQSAPGSSPVTLFLFGDEDEAYGKFWTDAIANKSCDAMSKYALATLSPDASGRVQGGRKLQGKEAHLWYAVAVDCETRQCPNVSSVNVTFMHPGSDGSHEACSAGSVSLAVLKEAMAEGWSALSVRNVLQVVGVTPMGVVIMYLCMVLLTLLSGALVMRGCSEPDQKQKELLYSAFFIVAISACCYLTMATGNGLLVLRKSGTGLKATWAYSNPLMATQGDVKHPNPLYDPAYARSPTYPFFYIRYMSALLTSPIMVHYICQVVGVPRSTTWSLLFTSASMVVCFFAAAAITGVSRWTFWAMGICFYLAVAIVMGRDVGDLAAKRGKTVLTVFTQLSTVVLVSWCLVPLVWLVGIGTKLIVSDVDISLHALLDLTTQCSFATALVKGGKLLGPSLARDKKRRAITGYDTPESHATPHFSGGGVLGDDLGDLEDNL